MRILGIDPGSRVTGHGVVERPGGGRRVIAGRHGAIRLLREGALAARLARLHAEICALVERERPDVAVVETPFVAASARAALVLGHARGAVLAALGAAGVRVVEVTPAEVKQAVTGHGSAEKAQVQAMVQQLLALPARPARDAADALAAALSFALAGRLVGLDVRRPPRRRAAPARATRRARGAAEAPLPGKRAPAAAALRGEAARALAAALGGRGAAKVRRRP